MTRHHLFKGCAAASALLLCTAGVGPLTRGQNPAPAKPQERQEDVVRVEAELVQTNVAVFDKSGKFVEGLTPAQFEVKVDGQVVPVAFMDAVTGGARRGPAPAPGVAAAAKGAPAAPRARGRTIVFFIDDLHLSLDSLGRTRSTLTRFLDEEMSPRDSVAFVTASGQLGFLQQFTSSQVPLRAAVGRLRHVPTGVRDAEVPPMTEYVAIRIQNGDREAASFYVDKIVENMALRDNRNMNRNAIFEMVKNRANQMVHAIDTVTDGSLSSLEKFIQLMGQAEGRKHIFYISDGFYLDSKNSSSGTNQNLLRITELAARNDSVLYSIDARGLFSPHPNATNDRAFDETGRLDRASVGESFASQDGLHTLAAETGGKFLKNQNYFDHWVTQNLEEAANYYVLAWRPEAEAQKGKKFKRVEVSVIGRPELTVRASRGYAAGARADSKAEAPAAKAAENELREALTATVVKRALPTAVSASFVDVPGSGPVLTSSVQVGTEGLDYGPDGKQPAAVDVVGIIFNDQGKQSGNFKARLNVTPLAPESDGASAQQGVIYNHRAPLAPGLYQVRAAARDARGGLVGSASEWIEIPDLSKQQLTLSSLHLGGRAVGGAPAAGGKDAPQVQFSVDRKFLRSTRVEFITFVYNGARAGAGPPDLSAQVKVYSGGRTVLASPANKLPVGPDPARVPFTGALSLGQLPAGLYQIEVTVTDNASKATAAQRVFFEIQ